MVCTTLPDGQEPKPKPEDEALHWGSAISAPQPEIPIPLN